MKPIPTVTVLGHIDRIDPSGVAGWALGGPLVHPELKLVVNGVEKEAQFQRWPRPDLAELFGPGALDAGFFVDLSHHLPSKPRQRQAALRSVRVLANGKPLKRSKQSVTPDRLQSGIVRLLGKVGSRHRLDFRAAAANMTPNEYKEFVIAPQKLSTLHGKNLIKCSDPCKPIRNSVVVFTSVRNERARLPFFLSYYRQMGIDKFYFVDNGSQDGSLEYLCEQKDCSVWKTDASYKESNFGVHWLNFLARRYGTGNWCLTIDTDEFLVFPHSETRKITDLVDFMVSEKANHLFCLLLDMYSEFRVSETYYVEGEDPLSICPFFDRHGYVEKQGSRSEVFIQGGPRRRLFFRDMPYSAPALNKTPLVFWRDEYSYLASTHVHSHPSVNAPQPQPHLLPSGCLMHFKFISTMAEKAQEERLRKQHYNSSIEYSRYADVIERKNDFLFSADSVRFRDTAQLINLGFMSPGRWF